MSDEHPPALHMVDRPRRWRWLKFTGLVVLGAISVGMIWFAVANWKASAQLNAQFAELKAQGVPLSLADLERTPPPPGEDATTYLRRAENSIEAINREIHAEWQSEEARQLDKGLQVPDSFDYSPTMIEAYRRAFSAHPEVVPLLYEASHCPAYFMDLNYKTESGSEFVADMLSEVQLARATARVLNYRMILLLSEGKREEAMENTLALLRLSNLFGQAPALVGQLVAIGIRGVSLNALNRVLRDGPIPQDGYDRLDSELTRQDLLASYRNSLLTERAVGLAYFNDTNMLPYSGLPHGKRDKTSYLKVLDVLIANADRPYGDPDAKAALEKNLQAAGPLTTLLRPAIEATQQAITRNIAQVRCLRVLNAILRRPSDQQTDIKLPDLDLPEGTTTDPFNGHALHLKHTDSGWLIYSVGGNLKDDGGQLDDDATDVGSAPIVSP